MLRSSFPSSATHGLLPAWCQSRNVFPVAFDESAATLRTPAGGPLRDGNLHPKLIACGGRAWRAAFPWAVAVALLAGLARCGAWCVLILIPRSIHHVPSLGVLGHAGCPRESSCRTQDRSHHGYRRLSQVMQFDVVACLNRFTSELVRQVGTPD